MNMMTTQRRPSRHPRWHLAALIAHAPTKEIEDAIEAMLAELDLRGGDPDVELNGDEADGTDAEDEILNSLPGGGPGCAVSDPDESDGDDLDASVPEWDGAPARVLPEGLQNEDSEEDDAPEDDDSDRCAAGDDDMIAGPVAQREQWDRWGRTDSPGSEDDVEGVYGGAIPAHGRDQSRILIGFPREALSPAAWERGA